MMNLVDKNSSFVDMKLFVLDLHIDPTFPRVSVLDPTIKQFRIRPKMFTDFKGLFMASDLCRSGSTIKNKSDKRKPGSKNTSATEPTPEPEEAAST
jgi:hypothetical protein